MYLCFYTALGMHLGLYTNPVPQLSTDWIDVPMCLNVH
jgi:hypothetical protein